MRALALQRSYIELAIISVIVSIVAVVAVAGFLVGFESLVASLRKLSLATVGACAVLMLWQSGCRCVRWFLYVRRLAIPISLGEAALFYAGGIGMAMTPGRIGETLRLWFLEKKYAVPYRRTAGLYVADRVSDAIAYLILLLVGVGAYEHGTRVAWGILPVVIAGVTLLMKPQLLLNVLAFGYARFGKGRRLILWLRRMVRNTSILFQPRVLVPGVAIGAAGWLAAPVAMILVLSELQVDFDLLRAATIYASAALLGGSTMMPGGGGATETVLVVLLAASGVPLEAAVTATIVLRLMFLWLPVGIGIVLLPVAMKAARAGKDDTDRSAKARPAIDHGCSESRAP